MPPSNTNLLQGTLDVLILKVLALQPMHGLGISNRIAQVTSNTFLVKPGSLFPALHRMEEAGWLTSSWRSEEHTSELQSHSDLVCRLLLEKKNKTYIHP